MRRKTPSRFGLPVSTVKLLVHTAMGAAMGLAFAMLLLVFDASFAALLKHQGSSELWLLAVSLITTFAVGATLTGALFMREDV